MNKFVIPAAVLAALAAPATAAEVHIQATGPVVELTVTESVEGTPDIVDVGAGVTTRANTAVDAMQQNATAMTAVVARIKALGIAERDIQTTGVTLGAQYDWDQQNQRQVFRGYQASNRVSVTLRDVQGTGRVLDALVAAGATDISGPNWSVEDDAAARSQARTTAMETARTRAMEYARLAGYSDIRLLEISESVAPQRPMQFEGRAALQSAAVADTPVQPGLVESSVTVTVKFELSGG